MKINFIKKKNSLKKKEFIFHANFYWRIILLGAAVTIFSSFIFSYRLFTQTNQESVLPPANENKTADVAIQDRISKALNYFSEKENKSDKILNSPPAIVDPSL